MKFKSRGSKITGSVIGHLSKVEYEPSPRRGEGAPEGADEGNAKGLGTLASERINEHVKLAEELDKDGRLPSTFMVVAPGSWDMTVWDDINRMRTLNTSQSRRRQQMHVCPLQLDIVERLINRYSNPGDLVADPFAGLFTVPYLAVKMGRKGKGVELNPDYFRDGVGYCETADAEQSAPTLFDLMEEGEEAAHA